MFVAALLRGQRSPLTGHGFTWPGMSDVLRGRRPVLRQNL